MGVNGRRLNHTVTLRYDKKLIGMFRLKLSRMRIISLLTDTPFSYESFEEEPSRLYALITKPTAIILRLTFYWSCLLDCRYAWSK